MTRAEMEQRRFEAGKLFAKGVKPPNVARRFGVTRTTARKWYKRYYSGKMEATKATGRPRFITRDLVIDAFESRSIWTAKEFQAEIHKRFGIFYDRDHVRRLLQRLRQAALASTERAG